MIINKKFDRLRQWTDERMGAKSKTETTDEFQDLEMEMGLRYEGMKRNQKAMSDYVKNMSQRQEGGDKEKMTPVALLGSTMATHGDDFANDSNFGQCLTMYGRTNERIARAQETYMAKASSTWLESTEKSLVQMKEYQASRKKMESRRLAYDTAVNKMEKNRKDDFRLEEEARIQKSKYEEANEDVHRRMLDIRESEAESVQDMGDFLDAQLAYYDRCREILMQLKQEWPGPASSPTAGSGGRLSRCNTSNSDDYDSPHLSVDRTRSRIVSKSTPVSRADSRERTAQRPVVQRSTTFEGPRQLRRDPAPPPPQTSDASMRPLDRIHSNPVSSRDQHLALRPVPPPSSSDYNSTPNSYATSPASSLASVTTGSLAAMRSTSGDVKKKAPPPPPPSRAKKPPPPPPPMRRGIVAGAYE